MAAIYFDPQGGTVLAVDRGGAGLPPVSAPSGAGTLHVGTDDNGPLVQAICDNPAAYSVAGGVLHHGGAVVAINPDMSGQRAVQQALAITLSELGPAAVSDRVTLRYVLTLLNDVREHVGLPRIPELAHLAGIQAAIAAGAGEPISP